MYVNRRLSWTLTPNRGGRAAGAGSPGARRRERPVGRGGGDVHQDIAPILQRSCQQCHHPDGVRADVADDLRRGAALGARDQDAHRAGPRAGAMPPWFVEKNIGIQHFKTTRRSARTRLRRSRSGPTAARRAAIRPTCRRRATADERRVDDRRTGSGRASRRRSSCRPSPRQVGSRRPGADRPHRGSLRVGGRGPRGQRHSAERRTNTVGGRYVFHHMTYRAS